MAYIFGDSLAQLGQAGGRAVVRPAFAQGADSSFDHIMRGIKVWFTDLQMDNFLALLFQGAGFVKNLKGSFRTQPRHALRQAKFVLCGVFHGASCSLYAASLRNPRSRLRFGAVESGNLRSERKNIGELSMWARASRSYSGHGPVSIDVHFAAARARTLAPT